MAELDFPTTPNVNDQHDQNGVIYRWTGQTWDIVDNTEIMLDRKVDRGGDTMSAPLYLPPANPTHGYEAAHKNYVDSKGGIVIAEAPPAVTEQGMWWDSATGKLYVGYTDTSGDALWVQVNGTGSGTV
jgi:hypothetical protein